MSLPVIGAIFDIIHEYDDDDAGKDWAQHWMRPETITPYLATHFQGFVAR